MSFGATPVDGSTTPIPMSSAVPDGTSTPLAVEGGPAKSTGGNNLAPVAVYSYDGYNVTMGTQADANTANTMMGRLTKIRDLLNATLPVSVTNATALGQATMANSNPVVIASDQTVKVKPDFLEVAGQAAGSVTGTGTDLFPSIDMSGYLWGSLSLSGTWNMTLALQWSNDNFATASFQGIQSNIGSLSGPGTTITANGIYIFPKVARYLRIRPTIWTSNASCVGTLELSTAPPPAFNVAVGAIQGGTWTVQPGNTQNTTPWLMAGPNANGTQAANSAANTVIKGTPGWLYHAIITTLGTAGLTIYDNATTNSGTPLLVIPASAAVGTIYSFPSGARAVNGITSAGVTNCPAVTFHYT